MTFAEKMTPEGWEPKEFKKLLTGAAEGRTSREIAEHLKAENGIEIDAATVQALKRSWHIRSSVRVRKATGKVPYAYHQEVVDYVAEICTGKCRAEIAEAVNKRFGYHWDTDTVHNFLSNHHLSTGLSHGSGNPGIRIMPEEAFDWMKEHYHGIGPSQMTELLNERFGLQLQRSQIKAVYARYRMDSGLTGRYEPGSAPKISEAGMAKFIEYGKVTRFQKGHEPKNKMPIGSRVIKADGCWWEKTGEGARDWKAVHRMEWEKANGPVPEGKVLVFLNEDRTDPRLENIRCVTRGTVQVMNKLHMWTGYAELNDMALIIAESVSTVRKAERTRKDQNHGKHKENQRTER